MNRDIFVDMAKGICICLIVVIHSPFVGQFPLTFIAVPLFFFMSGFYDRDRPLRSIGQTCWKKMLLPSIYFFAMAYLYVLLRKYVNSHDLTMLRVPIVNPAGAINGPIWFLFALMYAKFLMFFVNNLHIRRIFISGGVILIGFLGANSHFPMYLSEGMQCMPLYYFGKEYYKHKYFTSRNIIIAVVSLLLFVLALCGVLYYRFGINKEPDYGISYLISLMGILFSCHFFLLCCQYVKCSWIENLGKHTLGIMLIHSQLGFTLFWLVEKAGWTKNEYIGSILNIIMICFCILLSYQLTRLIKKYTPYLLGE